jgi:hypothetical protein
VDRVLSFAKEDLEQWQMVGELEHEREQEKEKEKLEEYLDM